MCITSLVPGFYSVVHPRAARSDDRLHIVNDFQLNILQTALRDPAWRPTDALEITAFENLESRGLLSHSDQKPQSRYPRSLSIWLHLTDQCPLRCVYCHVKKRDAHLHDETLRAFADMLVRTAQNKGLTEVNLRLAGGEPALRYAAIRDWIDETKTRLAAHGCSLSISMLSGLATLPTAVEEYVKAGGGISVSMDGIDATQDRVRPLANGMGSFEKVRENLEKLRASGRHPYILIVVSNENMDGLVDFTRWLIAENLGFRYSFQKGGELDRDRVTQTLRTCYDIIEQAKLDGTYTRLHRHRLADLSTLDMRRTACGAGRNSCSVYLDGDIFLCQMEHGSETPLGNVSETERDLCEILTDRTVRTDFHAPSAGCYGCPIEAHCAGGCPIDRRDAGGHNPNCALFREFLPRIQRILALDRLAGLIGNDQVKQLLVSH